jgi:CubicO group peptidase (beta-lactamase class C family)
MKTHYTFRSALLVYICCHFTFLVHAQNNFPYQNMVDAAAYAEDMDGAAVMILQNDSIVFENYHNGADTSVVTHIFSATKAYWSLIAAAAKEVGLISSYDESVSQTITEWQDNSLHPGKHLIQIKHLLSLSSGLSQDIFQLQGPNAGADDLYRYTVDSLDLNFTPGTNFQYGPSNYYAFGVLLQRKLNAAGIQQSPLDFLDSLLFQPIGLEYDSWEHDNSGNPHIPNGCYISPRNWMKFGKLLLQKGRWGNTHLVDSTLVEEMLIADGPNPGHGKFLWLNNTEGYGSFQFQTAPAGSSSGFIYHDGYTDIFAGLGAGKNWLYIIPSLNAVVLRQTLQEQDNFDDHTFLSYLFDGLATSTSHIFTEQDNIQIYPNPFSDKVVIDGDFSNYKIKVFDAIGNLVTDYSGVNSPVTIDLSALGNGMYFVSAQHDLYGPLSLSKIRKQ